MAAVPAARSLHSFRPTTTRLPPPPPLPQPAPPAVSAPAVGLTEEQKERIAAKRMAAEARRAEKADATQEQFEEAEWVAEIARVESLREGNVESLREGNVFDGVCADDAALLALVW